MLSFNKYSVFSLNIHLFVNIIQKIARFFVYLCENTLDKQLSRMYNNAYTIFLGGILK